MYAIKIGEIHLKSDTPITPEMQARALAVLNAMDRETYVDGPELRIVDMPSVHTLTLRRR